jgi:hypothetical protein
MLFDVYKCFMPECFLDTNLLEVLLERSNSVNHKKGNSSVAAEMDKEGLKDNFIVGIIDNDKVRVRKLDEFDLVGRLSKNGIAIYKHPSNKHYFIQLSPAIEQWVLNECKKGELDLANYDLPSTLKPLRALKGLTQRNDARFRRLFKDMLKKENCDEIIELKRWLVFLRDNNSNSDIDLL